MTYFESITHNAGLNAVPSNPCKLLDFNLLVLGDGKTYDGTSGNRELCAVLFGGKATFRVNDQTFEKVGGRPNVFSGKPHSVYIPC
ncbi:MAG TPA: 5-deoxy-glucuronate isomerase, partial [Anaerolineae bacterium]